MGTRAARTLHLVLFGLGVILYVVFVLPRWWVLTGDIPRTLATAGRIAAGIPIGLAALPVMQLLKAGLRGTPRPPELALRLRAWSGVLHVVAGALILLTAIVEIWLRLQVAGPWLFGVYGAAGAMAILGCLALYLSFVAEKPPAEAKAPKSPTAAKPKKVKKVTRVRADAKPAKPAAKPSTKRGRTTGKPVTPTGKKPQRAKPAPAVTAVADETVVVTEAESDATVVVASETGAVATTDTPDTAAMIVTDTGDDTEMTADTADDAASGVLRNKRPSGKSRHRLRR